MKRSKQQKSGGRPEKSKYARKTEDLAMQRREPFEFREEPHKPAGPPPRIKKPAPAPVPRPHEQLQVLGVVSGTVVLMAPERGFLFIELPDKRWIHVGNNQLKPDFAEHVITENVTVITCEATHFPGTRNPRSTKVLSVVG